MTRLLRRLRGPGDDGVTLVELSITILLIGVIGAFVSGAVIGADKIFGRTDDQTRGLQQVKVAEERLSRDVRDARAVVCNPSGTDPALVSADPSCQYHLQLWIDYNSDYVQQATETVTWNLVTSATTGHYSLVRAVNGSSQVEASSIVKQVAFGYCIKTGQVGTNPTGCLDATAAVPPSTIPAPGTPQVQVINVDMTYDALFSNGKKSNRTVTFSDRLRNVT